MQDLIGYDEIIENAMRDVIRKILKSVEIDGLPGGHYFVMSFLTKFPDVKIPEHLLQRFPRDMTIVIQHQFQNLKVEENYFRVDLSFSGIFERLVIPYRAITSFADPSMNFGLRFSISDNSESLEQNFDIAEDKPLSKKNSDEKALDASADSSQNVISLDAFRKNKNNNKNKKD